MGSLIRSDLTLDCSPSSIPKTTGEFLAEVLRTDDVSDKLSKLNDYFNRLQDEMKKIDAFKRELPLCMLLLNDAIATIKEEIMRCKEFNSKPVLEEFIPLKINSPDKKDERIEVGKEREIVNSKEKMSWMSSVQLWNSDDHLHTDNNNKKRKEEVVNRPITDDLFQIGRNRTSGKAFAPSKGCKIFPMIGNEGGGEEMPGVTSLSLGTPDVKNLKEESYCNGLSSKSSSSRSGSLSISNGQSNFKAEQHQSGRKQRRCWSQELHRRFVSALQQLGGAQAATPKQIRELMQVEGLTNDEVKSHLQKYRLHTRRVPNGGGGGGGGLWTSQEQCGESSKRSNSQSSSPHGPLHLTTTTTGSSRGTSVTGGEDSVEDEDDEKLESHSWKSNKGL